MQLLAGLCLVELSSTRRTLRLCEVKSLAHACTCAERAREEPVRLPEPQQQCGRVHGAGARAPQHPPLVLGGHPSFKSPSFLCNETCRTVQCLFGSRPYTMDHILQLLRMHTKQLAAWHCMHHVSKSGCAMQPLLCAFPECSQPPAPGCHDYFRIKNWH